MLCFNLIREVKQVLNAVALLETHGLTCLLALLAVAGLGLDVGAMLKHVDPVGGVRHPDGVNVKSGQLFKIAINVLVEPVTVFFSTGVALESVLVVPLATRNVMNFT